MTQIVVQPTGSPSARAHYRDTIASPVVFADFEAVAEPDFADLQSAFPDGKAAIWGVTPGPQNITKWNRIEVGDLVLFAARKRLFARGVVRLKFRNEGFADALWGRDEENRTWEYMYAIDDTRTLDLSYVDLNRAVGYAENNVFQGFQVLDQDKSLKAFALLDFSGISEVVTERGPVRAGASQVVSREWQEPVGHLMTREQRRAKYGGALYGGIEPSAQTPNVFVHSDPNKSAAYGYNFDGWAANDPDVYLYTGEGRNGDMTMSDGNAAILYHRDQGRALRLFVFDHYVPGTKQAVNRYVGEFAVDENHPYVVERAPDEAGEERNAFVFRLRPVSDVEHDAAHQSHHSVLVPVDPAIGQIIQSRPPVDLPELFGELDVQRVTTGRAEQDALRRFLIQGTTVAPCALCGMTYPVEFLVAAHIKKRSKCSDEEKRDIPANAMLACRFGCDELFERGFIAVAEDGAILTANSESTTDDLALRLEEYDGLVSSAFARSNKRYFEWHRENVFHGEGMPS